jgi:hypothetical protein
MFTLKNKHRNLTLHDIILDLPADGAVFAALL